MSKEVVAARSLKPGNFETSVEGVRFVLEVNKDEGAGLVGTYKLYVRSLSAVGMAEETEAPLVDAETEEEEEAEEGIAKHDTSTSVNIIVRVLYLKTQLFRVAVVLKYTKIR
jgi:hypothetical protein